MAMHCVLPRNILSHSLNNQRSQSGIVSPSMVTSPPLLDGKKIYNLNLNPALQQKHEELLARAFPTGNTAAIPALHRSEFLATATVHSVHQPVWRLEDVLNFAKQRVGQPRMGAIALCSINLIVIICHS